MLNVETNIAGAIKDYYHPQYPLYNDILCDIKYHFILQFLLVIMSFRCA